MFVYDVFYFTYQNPFYLWRAKPVLKHCKLLKYYIQGYWKNDGKEIEPPRRITSRSHTKISKGELLSYFRLTSSKEIPFKKTCPADILKLSQAFKRSS